MVIMVYLYDDRSCDFAVADYAERGGDGRARCTILHCISISFDSQLDFLICTVCDVTFLDQRRSVGSPCL